MSAEKKVMVTGHRPYDLTKEQIEFAQKSLSKIAKTLKNKNGMTTCISGGTPGADQWWGMLAKSLGLKLELHLPFPDHGRKWARKHQSVLEYLRQYAVSETFASEAYDVKAYHQRNDSMLKDSEIVVAVYSERLGKTGTKSVVEKARRLSKPLIIIDLDNLKVVKE